MKLDLSTRYCGLELANPIMPGASPLVDNLDNVRRLEDAGAAAIVMRSLFEEQIVSEELNAHRAMIATTNVSPEALDFLPDPDDYRLGPDEYLQQIARIRKAVDLPVIASLNGTHISGWVRYATLIEQAGADALELNPYEMASSTDESSDAIERRILELVTEVHEATSIPLAVKLLPHFAGLPAFAERLAAAGADALVMFNRAYQPVIDLEELEMSQAYPLSSHDELPLRLRWLGLVSHKVTVDLACSGGVYSSEDALRALMCGATVVQIVSAILRYGPIHLKTVLAGMREWMEDHEYESIAQMRGSMNAANCPDPRVYTRWGYIRTLQSWV